MQLYVTVSAELTASDLIILAFGNRHIKRDAGIAAATSAFVGFCVGCLHCLVLSFLSEQLIRIIFRLRCLGAQRKGEVEVLRFVAAIFGIVEYYG